MANARLTENFWLAEFLRSQTAERHGIDMTPNAQVVANITRLCVEVLQPIRKRLGVPIMVTSGYRPPEVNRLIGGSERSQHVAGLAADLVVSGHSVDHVFNAIARAGLPFDQLIHEFGQWVHVSVSDAKDKPRGQMMLAKRLNGQVSYELAREVA